jgi:hypothetical protein
VKAIMVSYDAWAREAGPSPWVAPITRGFFSRLPLWVGSKYMPSGYGHWNSTRNAKRLEPESSTPRGQALHEGMPISSGIMRRRRDRSG